MFRSYRAVLAVIGVLGAVLTGCGGGSSTLQYISITGTWLAVSATKDGQTDTLADAFAWDTGTTSMTLTFNNNGTWVETELGAGSVIIGQRSGTWSSSGDIITWQQTQPTALSEPDLTYGVSGNTATFSFTPTSGSNSGHKIVATFSGTSTT